jgi:DNA-binding transcriptional MerR regulator
MAAGGESQTSTRPEKSRSAFRTISEVSADLDVPQHVLRFWESKFPQVKPLKRGGGRRYYRPEDVDLLRRIRELLYRDGYTIRGVQRLLREGAKAPGGGEGKGRAAARPRGVSASKRAVIEEVLRELTELRDELRGG